MTDQSVNEAAGPVEAGDAETTVAGDTADQSTPSLREKLEQAVKTIKERLSGAGK